MRNLRSIALVFLLSLAGLPGSAPGQEQPGGVEGQIETEPPAPVPPPDDPCQPPLGMQRTRGLSGRAAALIMSGQQGGGVAFSFLPAPLASRGGVVTLGYIVDIDLTSLLGERRDAPTAVEVAVYAMASAEAVSAASTGVVELEPDLCPELFSAAGLRVMGALDVPENLQAVRILVRNLATGAFGVGELPRVFGVPAEGGAQVSVPLAVEPAAWLVAFDKKDADLLAPLHTPGWIEPGKVISSRPLVASGQEVLLVLPGRGVAAGTRSLQARVIDRQASLVSKTELVVGDRQGGGMGSLDLWQLRWKVPSLDPELYFLELSVPGVLPGSTMLATMPFIVVASTTPPAPTVWAALDDEEQPEEESRREVLQAGRRGRPEASPKVKAGYLEALRELDRGGVDAVVAALFELERGSLTTGSPRELDGVLWAEIGVARDLAGEHPDSALALAGIHLQLHERYVRSRAFVPQAHARRAMEAMTELWVGRRKTPEARAQAAELLALLGAALQRLQLDASAARLFKRSTEVDPTCAAGLVALAAGLERQGAYRTAMRFLEELVAAHPNHAEGRLRLAINHMRVGSDSRAEALFRSLMGEGVPEWVRIVAVQELVRWEIGRGRLDPARRLLVTARKEGVVDAQVDLQLAFVLDRLGRGAEAFDLASAISARRGGSVGVSPRLHYGEWPKDDLAAARERLDAAMPGALQALAEAVRRTAREGAK